MTNKVFIGMPAYNGERFIKEAIDSLINQSYTNWELFISDDASTDNTEKICKEYAEKDLRITYYRQEKNLGIFSNFKFLLDRAEGDYFMWAGRDDLWDKEFIKICVKNLDNNKNIDISSTGIADVDSFGRTLRELSEFPSLSGKPGIISIIRYILQPEILGKCNIMCSLFRFPAIKKIWEIYPQRQEWGSDYHFSLAAISHFGIFIEPRILFKKRHGGFSNPLSTINDKENIIRKIEIKNPKNHMFPFGRFNRYFNGHMEALDGTPYKALAAILLYSRIPRSFIIHVKEKINNKFKKYA
ncbi:glycosyltransferase [Patescibacteria group bacterium]|nr:glycosyltransferase [Patescibacteria group bacterium]MBU4057620.1 glycosyltransferase [Patescibacteria group bacterium]MBU4115770.1 glycosyltransferase [Patescibacteria group bacterium]